MLDDIPDQTHCFVDANIICYYLIETEPFSDQCARFIKRIENGVLVASTSAAVIAEATHKVLLAEAVEKHGLDHKGLAHRLQRRRELIATLSEHQKVTILARALSIHVEPITTEILERAAQLSPQHRLLTNDALSVAVMERLGLSNMVSNDDNFDSIPGLTIWKPR
jgi:predicted nucleic acid-binding protein